MDDNSREAMIATLVAEIRASPLNRAASVKEPLDGPREMMPVAYAMFEVLAESCIASGYDELAWWDFLREALAECICRAEKKAFEFE
jgi:hypothetical protein